MSTQIDAYLKRLESELAARGIRSPRIVEEAREHLADAVADAMKRGLSADATERDALARFGTPELVAAQAVASAPGVLKSWMPILSRLKPSQPLNEAVMTIDSRENRVGFARTIWKRRWWILVPTLVSVAVTSILSYYFLPTRYRSEALIIVVPGRVSPDYVQPSVTGHLGDRLALLNEQIMSRTRLERIISDFGLYELERKSRPPDEVIERMRGDIRVTIVAPRDDRASDAGAFRIGYTSQDPRTAQQVTERLSSLFVEFNLRDREVQAEGTLQFLGAQILDVRNQIVAYETRLEGLRSASRGRPLSQADLLPYEVLKDTYRVLLAKNQESRMAANLERRQIGEQFKILDPARLPQSPVGPNRARLNAAAGLTGLGGALAFVGLSSRRQRRSDSSAA